MYLFYRLKRNRVIHPKDMNSNIPGYHMSDIFRPHALGLVDQPQKITTLSAKAAM